MRETDLLCHELLLRLAGRLPDRHLWRYRDWLDGDAADVIARTLPSTLVRERVELGDAEHRRLSDALLPLGASPGQIDAVLPGSEPRADRYTFSAESPADRQGDPELLVLGATLRGRQGIGEVRSTWRIGAEGTPKRVVLVVATADVIELTGEIQRILRALGEHDPGVEVFSPEMEANNYHRRALAESILVCTGAVDLVGQRG